MNNPRSSHTHCQATQANRTSQNLSISMSLPTQGEMKLVTNLKEKKDERKPAPNIMAYVKPSLLFKSKE